MSTIPDPYGGHIRNAKEQHCIVLVAAGLTNKQVSRVMRTTEDMVKKYLKSIYNKLGLWNRVELALWYEHRKWEMKRADRQTLNSDVASN